MKGGSGQKKTPQGLLATVYLLCLNARKKSNDGKMGNVPNLLILEGKAVIVS
jgi:hypothetical protein